MGHTSTIQFVLASASARRSAMLRDAGYRFDVRPCPLPEPADLDPQVGGAAIAEATAFYKAERVAEGFNDDTIVVGADTIVEQHHHVFGKPADAADARRILSQLMSNPHDVITGVAMVQSGSGRRLITHDVTRVYMRPMSPDELDAYIESGMWRGKAGAYGIQDTHDAFITRIEGSWTNVVGLPLERVTTLLEAWDVVPAGKTNPRQRDTGN